MEVLHAISLELVQGISWGYAASGFGVGFLVGLTGVGGGSLMTPLLILLFGIHPATAVGTDLLYACVTKSGGGIVHALHKTIDWSVVGRLALGSVPASILTLGILHFLKIDSHASNRLITNILGPALMLTALALIFRQPLLRFYARRSKGVSPIMTWRLTVATGAILGGLVTLSSVGAGALGVTVLILLYPTLPISRIVGSDIAHAVPLTLVSGAGHWLLGSIDFSMLASLLVGSLPGIVIASFLAPRAPERVLRFLLAGVLVLVAVRLMM